MDAASGKPIPKAKVYASPPTDSSKAAILRTTNEQGEFCFDRLDPGTYEVIAHRPGYLTTVYGAKPGGQQGLPLRVDGQNELPRVTIQLLRAATIAGVVLDANGDPREGGEVQLNRKGWDKGWTSSNVTTTEADSGGAFRFPNLPPGTYYLVVRPHNDARQFLDDKGQPIRTSEAETWYNGSPAFAHATPIPLQAGQNLDNLVVTVNRVITRHVTGRLSPAFPRDEIGKLALDVGDQRVPFTKDGAFQVEHLSPDRHRVRVSGGKVHADTDVDLTNGDADGLVIEPVPLLEIRISARLEGGGSPPGHMQLQSLETDFGTGGNREGDGPYRFQVPAGSYRLEMPRSAHLFVKAIAINGEAHSGAVLDLRKGSPGAVEAILSSNLASIDGHVDRPEGAPLSFAVTAVLVDEAQSQASVFGPTVIVDHSGKFQFESLTPGKYRAFAIEGFDEDLWGSAELAAALREKSVAVELHEGEKKSLAVPLIASQEWAAALRKVGM